MAFQLNQDYIQGVASKAAKNKERRDRGGASYLDFDDGDTTIRILPGANASGIPFKEIHRHCKIPVGNDERGQPKFAYHNCLEKSFPEAHKKCPGCATMNILQSHGKDLNPHYSQNLFYCNAIDRKDQTVKLCGLPPSVFHAIALLMANPEKNVTELWTGVDLIITKTGKGMDTRYHVNTHIDGRSNVSNDASQVFAWVGDLMRPPEELANLVVDPAYKLNIGQMVDLDAYFRLPDNEYISKYVADCSTWMGLWGLRNMESYLIDQHQQTAPAGAVPGAPAPAQQPAQPQYQTPAAQLPAQPQYQVPAQQPAQPQVPAPPIGLPAAARGYPPPGQVPAAQAPAPQIGIPAGAPLVAPPVANPGGIPTGLPQPPAPPSESGGVPQQQGYPVQAPPGIPLPAVPPIQAAPGLPAVPQMAAPPVGQAPQMAPPAVPQMAAPPVGQAPQTAPPLPAAPPVGQAPPVAPQMAAPPLPAAPPVGQAPPMAPPGQPLVPPPLPPQQ